MRKLRNKTKARTKMRHSYSFMNSIQVTRKSNEFRDNKYTFSALQNLPTIK